jgi:dihydroxy-acid dehydratase
MEPGRVRDRAAHAAAGEGAELPEAAREVWAGDMAAAYAGTLDGSVSDDEYLHFEDACCGGAGACGVMGTANTMHLFAEASGLTLPGNAVAPGGGAELEALAHAAGERAVGLVREGLRPSAVLTQASLLNGVRAVVAAGGSTCAVMHVLALAAEAGLQFELDDFDRLSRSTPLVVDVRPSGRYSATDFHRAGGVQGLLATLAPLLDLEARTVAGMSLGEQIAAATADRALIRPLDDPLCTEGGIAVLRGSLAPEGAVFKQSGSPVRRFQGPARVFETEEEAGEAILAGDIVGGEVLVVRSNGPVGAPGMPCLYGSVWLLKSRGLDDKVALVTDGRLSGTIRGLAVAHVSPESAVGGPLGAVEDGDLIVIDIDRRRLDLAVDESEVAARLAARPPVPLGAPAGILTQYRALVGPTHRGGVLVAASADPDPAVTATQRSSNA